MKRPLRDSHWRVIIAFALMIGSVVIAIILGLLCGGFISLLNNDNIFFLTFYKASVICYFWFFAGITVAGILVLITILPPDLAIGFGAGLYYGTIFLSSILRDYIHTSDINLYFISGVIVALICYIIWLKGFQARYNNKK